MTRPTGMKLLRRAEPFLRVLAVVAGAAAMLMPTGCATRNRGPVAPAEFFPAPPAPPRLQYLTSLSRPEDFEPPPNALLTYLVGRPPARRALAKPYGVAMKDGRIFICDSQTATIHVLSLEQREWEYFMPSGAGRLRKPINIDIDAQGNRYVADTQQGRILVYDAEGRYLNAVGQDMDMKPVDVLVAEDYLYVADLQNHVVRVFDPATRELLRMIPAVPKNE
ncbi:MAG: hypothetical protein K9N49_10560 [Candidatus Marinimicrobia bacterium]|nr:hypothetical protein [Candidatus Neomarinimicrobiota bacterium]